MKINIISDGNISTVSLLEQVLKGISPSVTINKIPLQNLNFSLLFDSLCIFCRNCLPGYDDIPKLLKKNGVPYIYYIDDNLWELKGESAIAKYHSHPLVLTSLTAFVENASLVITSTKRLEEYIRNSGFNDEVITLPNFVDFSTFDKVQMVKIREKKTLTIGYAGSAKEKAFQPVLNALSELKDEGYEFLLEFVGFRPKDKRLDFEYFPFMHSYEDYIFLVKSRGWDLALAPFEEDYFWSFKTDNKYREYSALSLPAIYSNVTPYNMTIIDGINGLLVDNSVDSWKIGLKRAMTDELLRATICVNSERDVRNRYDLNIVKDAWSEVIIKDRYIVRQRLYFSSRWLKIVQKIKLHFFLIGRFINLMKSEGGTVAVLKVINYLRRPF